MVFDGVLILSDKPYILADFRGLSLYFNIIKKRYTTAKEKPISVKIKEYQIMYDKDLLCRHE